MTRPVSVRWTDDDTEAAWLLADVMRSRYRHPSQPGLMPPVVAPETSHIGHAIGIALGFTLALAGIVTALVTPPLSGGTIAGVALFGLGAATALRIASIHDRQKGTS
jgi:hypothetical protein